MECFVCGILAKEGETFIETEDGYMCPECAGDIEHIEDNDYGYFDIDEEMDISDDESINKDPSKEAYDSWKI